MTENKPSILVISADPKQIVVKRQRTNQPELRHALIYNKLSKNSNIFTHTPSYDINLNYEKLYNLNVHSEKMITFLANCYASWKKEGRYDTNFSENTGIIPYNVTKFNYNTINNKSFINELPYFRQCGIWCDDNLSPIFEDTWTTVIESVNNCFTVKDYINDFNVIYCLNPQPGHHAKYDSYGGYCFLNNGAIIAKSLSKKCAILDIDYHAGNGTSNIFTNSDKVLTISIHANPALEYPFYESYEDENTKTNINIIFHQHTDIRVYMNLLEKALAHISDFNPDYLIIPFGGDTFKNDPDASPTCRCMLDIPDYMQISNRIRKVFKKQIIVCQEGGYDMENISEIVETFLLGLV